MKRSPPPAALVPTHEDGLHEALERLTARRKVLSLFAGASLLPFLSCGGTQTSADGSCSVIPAETAGPYPADGTNNNGLSSLTATGIVRRDIRSSFGAYSGTAAGVPLTVTLSLVDINANCAPLANAAVYLWHCDIDGQYSLYTVANQNYLRGVQETDANGQVTFQSIFPGAYSGRWPHIHFEIFSSLASATVGGNALKTSQLALPKASCDLAYATAGYASSVTNLARSNLSTDNVFSDGVSLQLATVTGDATAGFAASLTVGVAA